MSISVAVVGSGPAAFYTIEALVKSGADCHIDIIERLPAPYGLIRYGVAPDHQTTKNVSRNFSKTADQQPVCYFGHVEIGKDIHLNELRRLYDAVVLATGAPLDRPLAIPGADKAGVYGSATFVGWYNGHPDYRDLDLDLSIRQVVVIGNGNVAVDVARVLVKTRNEMAKADIPAPVLDAIQAGNITDVYMVGRRGPVEAKFTNVELREMGELTDAAPVIQADDLPAHIEDDSLSDRDRRLRERNLKTLRGFLEQQGSDKPKRVHFTFFAAPVEILGDDEVTAVRFERTHLLEGRAVGTGAYFEIPCGMVVAAIGYRSSPLDGVPYDKDRGLFKNDDGRIEDGLYAVGWAKRGPTGVIGSNRPDGRAVAAHIVEDFPNGSKPGRQAFESLLQERCINYVDLQDWQQIDAAEIAAARPDAPREKFITVADMLALISNR